jgi:hypothetical protein
MEVISEIESDLDKFVNVNVAFEKNKMEIIKDVYNQYILYHEFDEDSVKRGEVLSRIKFTKLILKNYKDYVYAGIQRVRGGAPARTFIGMRLKTFDEIVAEEAAKERENASMQVSAPAQEQKAAVPVAGPIEDDENPF